MRNMKSSHVLTHVILKTSKELTLCIFTHAIVLIINEKLFLEPNFAVRQEALLLTCNTGLIFSFATSLRISIRLWQAIIRRRSDRGSFLLRSSMPANPCMSSRSDKTLKDYVTTRLWMEKDFTGRVPRSDGNGAKPHGWMLLLSTP